MSDKISFNSETIRQITRSKRFLAADRAKMNIAEIATWDPWLLREHRLLVPIDVQALYVQPGSSECMVRLPMLLAGENDAGVKNHEDGMPEPFAKGEPRPSGVHLHWAMPDALLRGSLKDRADGVANRLSLPLLPDRWVVLRIVLPKGATDLIVTGWVLEAELAIAVPLGSWTEGGAHPQGVNPVGTAISREQLTGAVGGSVSWSAVYDAVLNRFSFHDPLSDLDTLVPSGVDEECASYVVAGWWSDAAFDPLDKARSSDSLHELLERLRWRLMCEWGDEQSEIEQDKAQFELRKALGLITADRWSNPRPTPDVALKSALDEQKATAAAEAPIETTFMEVQKIAASSAFATEASVHYVANPWHLRSSLLHGSVYGVPVRGAAFVDRRPGSGALSVAIGQHDDDLLAAFASAPEAKPEERRATERLLTAFTAQKVGSLASANGLVELEEHEHSASFSSQPGGSAGTDRYMQRVQTGGVGGLELGKKQMKAINVSGSVMADAQMPTGKKVAASETLFSTKSKPTLVKASTAMINDVARSRVGEVLAPTEARVVDRPAARFTFPDEPMVAIRGACRSLRHGEDGRGSADGKLTCRWPTHVISQISGVIPKDRFIASLGNGSIPGEVLTLAREAVLHDPYHNKWIASAVTPNGGYRAAILKRLKAESVLRFGSDGAYDGSTAAFRQNLAKTPEGGDAGAAQISVEPGVQQQRLIADGMRKFSLYKGMDPDLVGVTTWAQPWIPMWLEWEVKVEGLDPATLDNWRLGTIDLEQSKLSIEGKSVILTGRSQLTTGAASTLHDAISDWLKNEDALDGLVDEATENSYSILDKAVYNLDVMTAALEVRAQLLGFKALDGLRRPCDGDGNVTNPAPERAPSLLLAGCLKLNRARLLDVFGRTLDLPLNNVLTPSRLMLDDRPGSLAIPPRLLRPARWQFRLVDAATSVGSEGVEARVDQIEPSLQINPVAGFLLPDHLDESLEVFDVNGSAVGELLHEPVSGGVMWEIAPGLEGPADAGRLYGLAPAQQALGNLAAGLVIADAMARQGAPLDPESKKESALSAMLRAIDTTLWTIDTFASMGSEHVAGLVGRPIAVVRAQLRLELKPPTDVDLTNSERAKEWSDAEAKAATYAFPVRIGELTRNDDGVLGFFVDDDYSRFRLVDKVIAGSAPDAGRSRGNLGLYGHASGIPAATAIDHPYIAGTDDADTLMLHLGQTVTLTLLMLPAGKVSLTSGLLPRKALALARDWVGKGLSAIAPSLRTGPVLVETDLDTEEQIRLPKVSVFGKDQNFLWRDTPATWRTDAILAATQTALLPEKPAELREGWIRVAPDKPKENP